MVTVEEIQRQIKAGEPVEYSDQEIEAWLHDPLASVKLRAPVRILRCRAVGGEHWLAGVYVPPNSRVTYVRGVSNTDRTDVGAKEIEDAILNGECVGLTDCTVHGTINKWNPRIRVSVGGLILKNCGFVDRGAVQDSCLSLSAVDFAGPVCVTNVDFDGSVEFFWCDFQAFFEWKRGARLDDAGKLRNSIRGSVTFCEADFHSTTSITGIEVNQEIVLTRCEFRNHLRVWACRSVGLDMQGSTFFKGVALGENEMGGRIDFSGCRFQSGGHFGDEFAHADLHVDRARIGGDFEFPDAALHHPPWRKRLLSCFSGEWSKEDLSTIATDVSGCTNLRFRHWVEERNYEHDIRDRNRWFYCFWLASTDCGRSIGIWLTWMAVLVTSFALILYPCLEDHDLLGGTTLYRLRCALLYSIASFLSVEISAFVPEKSLYETIFKVLEGAVGYGMLGLLIAILADRVVRRS